MEQPSGQIANLPDGSVTPGGLPSDYWNDVDALYSAPPEQQHQPQPPAQQQQPLGISWDHPIFRQRHQQHSPQDPDHGIYSQPPQSWHQNSFQQTLLSPPQGYRMPPQYPQIHHYPPQGPVAYESPFSSAQNYYPAQQIPVSDTFSPRPAPRNIQPRLPHSTVYQPAAHQTPITQYAVPTGYPQELMSAPIDFRNSYHEPATSFGDQQTINPQFLNASQGPPSQQRQPVHDNFLYLSPADFQRNNSVNKAFNRQYVGLQAPTPNRNTVNPLVGFPENVAMAVNNRNNLQLTRSVTPATYRKTSGSKTARKVPSKASERRAASVSSDSESSGEFDLEILPDEPSPIPPTRPSDPTAAAQYDTIKAVWYPRRRRPGIDSIKNALVAFKDVVKAVRDVWKEKTQAMKMAENKGENDKAAELKKDVVLQRGLMDVVIKTTLEMGHPSIVEKLGEHPMSVTAMYSFLLDRHHASDVDSVLTTNILKLLARFVTMDEETLNKTNVGKLLPRFQKKGGQTVKELAQKVLDNAAASTKKKQEAAKAAPKEGSPVKSNSSDKAATNGVRTELAGSKRPREGENNGVPSNKRVVVASNAKNGAKSGNSSAAPDTKAATRPKANIVAPKPTNLFGSLSSASKRPGTSNAERAAAAAAAKANGNGDKKENAAPAPKQPTFSFGDLMADLNKPKETAAEKPVEDRPPETEEERAKRLRKEERRKLRVSWKPEHSLAEVRLFTHDPEEELGPGDSSRREAGDVKGEGRVLKLHRELDEEDEEDDSNSGVDELLTYHETSGVLANNFQETDFGEIAEEDRSRNFVKRGGTQQPDSPEKLAQEHREATTLMVFYTSPEEVPPSPKEPPSPSPTETVPEEVPFGEPPDYIKARQEHYYSVVNPKPTPSSQPNAPNGQDISSLLRLLQNAPQQPTLTSQPPPPPVQQPAPMSDLERTINMFRQQQTQPQPQLPQVPQIPATQPPQGPDFQQILAIINAQKQMQQIPQPQPQPQQTQPAIAPNLAAVISQLANPNQQAASAHSEWQNAIHEDPERKRMRESRGGYDGAGEERHTKRTKMSGESKEKKPKVINVVPCKFWRQGHCAKGEACTYRHD